MQLFGRPKRSCILREHSFDNMAVLKGKYLSPLVNQHLCCWGVACRIPRSKLQFHSQHCYKVSRCWIPCSSKRRNCSTRMGVRSNNLKEESTLLVPSMIRISDSLYLSPAFKVQTSKAKSHMAQSKLWVSTTLRRGWPWPRASHCLGWRVEGSPLWVWNQELWIDIIIYNPQSLLPLLLRKLYCWISAAYSQITV